MLEGGPLKSDWFPAIAKNYVAYLNITTHIDSPATPDQGLLGKKGGGGFPFAVFMDHEGAVLKTIRTFHKVEGEFKPFSKEMLLEDQVDAEKELAKLNSLREKAKMNPDDKVAGATLAIEVAMRHGGNAGIENLKQAAATPGVDKGLVKRFEGFLADSQISAEMEKAMKIMQADGNAKAIAYLKVEYTKLFKAGVRVGKQHPQLTTYFSFVMQAAVKAKDVETATAVVSAATATGPERFAARLNKQLQDLKDALDSDEEKGDDTKDDGG